MRLLPGRSGGAGQPLIVEIVVGIGWLKSTRCASASAPFFTDFRQSPHSRAVIGSWVVFDAKVVNKGTTLSDRTKSSALSLRSEKDEESLTEKRLLLNSPLV